MAFVFISYWAPYHSSNFITQYVLRCLFAFHGSPYHWAHVSLMIFLNVTVLLVNFSGVELS